MALSKELNTNGYNSGRERLVILLWSIKMFLFDINLKLRRRRSKQQYYLLAFSI